MLEHPLVRGITGDQDRIGVLGRPPQSVLLGGRVAENSSARRAITL
jgi:hypothetical protein